MTGELVLLCPACGGLIEAGSEQEVVRLSREHCRDAHGYEVPVAHVLDALHGRDADPAAATSARPAEGGGS